MANNRVQFPFIVDTIIEAESKQVATPVVGASVTVESRTSAEPVTVYATETEAGAIIPTTDSNGRINGWIEEGAYKITVTGGKPFIAATVYNWDALSGRGIENPRVGKESVWRKDLRKDENLNDTESVLEALVPTGTIFDFGGTSAPTGYLLTDGKSYPTAEYNRLFKVIGYNFGGSGANFNVPDTRGRGRIGTGSGPGLTVRTIGTKEGIETVALTTAQLASHTHSQTAVGGTVSGSASVTGTLGGTIADHNHYPPENRAGWSYLTHALTKESAPRYLTSETAGEVEVLWGNAGANQVTGSITGTVGCSVSGTLNGTFSGTMSSNSATTGATGIGEGHPNMIPFVVATGIIKT